MKHIDKKLSYIKFFLNKKYVTQKDFCAYFNKPKSCSSDVFKRFKQKKLIIPLENKFRKKKEIVYQANPDMNKYLWAEENFKTASNLLEELKKI